MQLCVDTDTGVVDENVEPAEACLRVLDDRVGAFRRRDVVAIGIRHATRGADLLGHLFRHGIPYRFTRGGGAHSH